MATETILEQITLLAHHFTEGVRRILMPHTAVPPSLQDELGDEAAQFAELFAPDPAAEHTGLMVAIPLTPDVAGQLAIEGGERPDQLHITLAYVGDTAVLSDEEVAGAILAACRIARDCAPLVGQIGGVGRFNASNSSGGQDVIYAVVDVPGLERLRQELVACLGYYEVPVSQNHGFNPHITLAYVDPGTPGLEAVPTIPLRVDHLLIAVGGKTIMRPLTGSHPYDHERGHIYTEMTELCARHTSEADGRTRLFFPFRFAEALPARINYRPIPGIYHHAEYGQVVVTRDSNQRMVDNFNNGVYQTEIPIDAEHQTKLSGAVAWVKRMFMNDDGSVDAELSWTERGKKLLKSGQFKFFSPEWYGAWCDPATEECYTDVATGGAITTRPFFKEKYLRPLLSTEMAWVAAETAVDARPQTGTDDVIPAGGDAPATNTHKEIGMSNETSTPAQAPTAPPPQAAAEPTPVSPQAFAEIQAQLAQLQASLTAVTGELKTANEARATAESHVTALAQANEQLTEQVKLAGERVAVIEKTARLNRFTDMVDGGHTGHLWFGEPEAHINMLTTLADTFGEDSEQFKAYVTQQETVAEAMAMSDLFREIGSRRSDVRTVEQKIETAVDKLLEAKPTMTREAAWAEVMAAQPQLYEEYLAETEQN